MKEKFQLSHIICICREETKINLFCSSNIISKPDAMVNSRVGGYWSKSTFLNLNEGERCLGLFYLGYVENEISKNLLRKDISKDTKWQ